MFVAFTIAFPIGAMWARYRPRASLDRIRVHRQLQLFAGITAAVAFILVLVHIGTAPHFTSTTP